MIPQSFIQDLLGRVDIVDVVDRHVKLKRAGANYVACCPFHSEKTPSFTVSAPKQFYHCFGCGAHGTAVGFLMEYSGLGFVDAVKELAQSAGMTLPEVHAEPVPRKGDAGDDLHGVLLKAAHFYRAQLKDAAHAIDYLKRRGLSGEIAKRFGIGYAPAGWQNLAQTFPNYQANSLVAAGLVIEGEAGKRYDRFRNRIMFPIVNDRGDIVGFGGRVLDGGEPKYLNSPETAVFEKGRELYGLYQARKAMREAKKVLVVEGYMDVIGLAQHGVGYAVATLGTSATSFHIQKLLRLSDDVVFCFDGDEAGHRAAWRALENSLPQAVDGKTISFLFLPEGEDPDTYVRKCAEDDIWTSVPLSEFLVRELKNRVDLRMDEGRAKLLEDARPLVKQVTAPLLSLMLRKRLAELSGVTLAELDEQYQIRPQPANAPKKLSRTAPMPLDRRLLRIFVDRPVLAANLSAEHEELLTYDPKFEAVAALVQTIKRSKTTSTAAVLEVVRDSQYARLYEDVAGETLLSIDDKEDGARADLVRVFAQLELNWLQRECSELSSREAPSENERLRFQKLSRRLAELKGVGAVNVRSQI
jgi:DNA primase